jgi:hypothetical protein
MLRLSRRCSTALLWLAIALLPVRGWAVTLMPMAMGAPAQAMAVEAEPAAPSVMPCHGAMAAEATAAASEPTTPTCSLCDLCHTTVAQAPSPLALPASPEAAAPPAASPSRVASRLPDGLFRPPRAFLA